MNRRTFFKSAVALAVCPVPVVKAEPKHWIENVWYPELHPYQTAVFGFGMAGKPIVITGSRSSGKKL